jgi:ribosomal protein S6
MMKKQKSGYYVVLVFSLKTEKITKFKERLKLGTDVFRYQFKGVNRANLVSEAANEV